MTLHYSPITDPFLYYQLFSKVIEKVIGIQVNDFFVENKLFFNHQYGFRSGHSTELAALELTDRIITALDNHNTPLNIFLDLSKAFDTLDHTILLDKLLYYGIRSTAYNLLRSYLTNREQFVELNDTASKTLPIVTGVPQGSILGPLLFLILGGCPFNGPLSGTKYPTRAASPIQNASTPKSSLPFSKHRSCALLCAGFSRTLHRVSYFVYF